MISCRRRGEKSFLKRNFKEAILFFSLALEQNPNDIKSKIFVILSDFAFENENEAMSIFNLLYENKKNSMLFDIGAIKTLIASISNNDSNDELYKENNMNKLVSEAIELEDGISFDDFLKFVEKRGDFNKAYEDMSFSTKILISKKEDFVYFLELLIQHGYKEQSLKHIENALQHFQSDFQFQELFLKANKDLK